MGPAGSVAGFARKRLVFAFGQLLSVVGMAFHARGLSGPKGLPRSNVLQRVRPVMAVLPKRRGRQEVARREISAHDPNRQQHQADDLRRHFEQSRHRVRSKNRRSFRRPLISGSFSHAKHRRAAPLRLYGNCQLQDIFCGSHPKHRRAAPLGRSGNCELRDTLCGIDRSNPAPAP